MSNAHLCKDRAVARVLYKLQSRFKCFELNTSREHINKRQNQ